MPIRTVLSSAKNAVLRRVQDFIDTQITKRLEPFLVMGEVDGTDYSDIVVDKAGDISIENMLVNTAVANEAMQKQGLPFRVSMVRAKRLYIDLPWENFGSGAWKLEVEGLIVVVRPLERENWSLETLRKAKEASVEAALAALIKKLKTLDAKGTEKKSSIFSAPAKFLRDRFFSHIDLEVHVKDVHLRLERSEPVPGGEGEPSQPAFSFGFVLPSCDVETVIKTGVSSETTVSIGRGQAKAGVYCNTGDRLHKLPDQNYEGDLSAVLEASEPLSPTHARHTKGFFAYQDRLREWPFRRLLTALRRRPVPRRRAVPLTIWLRRRAVPLTSCARLTTRARRRLDA